MHVTTSSVSAVALGLLVGCGGSGGEVQHAGDVNCPPGQTYDGEFCQVDQTVATAERPAPANKAEPVEVPSPGEAPGETKPANEKPAGEVDEEPTEGQEEPSVEEQPEEAEAPEQATPVDVMMAAQAGPIVQYLASSHLPAGARPMGSPFAGQFAEGQILEQNVQLTAGKCFTVVAAGLPPIKEVNLELFAEGQNAAVAADSTSGSQAVLGSRDSCFKPVASGAYRLVLTVASGRGVAAAQVFQK